MYPNFSKMLKDNKIPHKFIAELLNISTSTFSCKMNGKSEFKINETKKIKDNVFPNETIDFIFATSKIDKEVN